MSSRPFNLSPILNLIFSAAFLVKVTASISSGPHLFSSSMDAMLFVRTQVLPDPAQAITLFTGALLLIISVCCFVPLFLAIEPRT